MNYRDLQEITRIAKKYDLVGCYTPLNSSKLMLRQLIKRIYRNNKSLLLRAIAMEHSVDESSRLSELIDTLATDNR